MPQTTSEAASRSNYQPIFDGALEAYQRKTGKDLTKDPLLRTLETCNSPDAILTTLRGQILQPGQSHDSTDKLTTWLIPTVKVINAFSETIGEALALVSSRMLRLSAPGLPSDYYFLEAYPPAVVIFTGIGVFLSVSIYIDLFH